MSIEIEKKFVISKVQMERLIKSLSDLNADYIGEDLEENIIYRNSILKEKNAVLRVRKIDNKTILTYKESFIDKTEIKHQKEYETEIKDVLMIEKIIENLGLEKSLVYEKRRKTWKFRDVEIVLDELPFGFYMEIEGSVLAIKEVEILLEAEEFETEHKTYPALTAKFGNKNGQLFEARF
jgi:adenylate cyclase class 2